MSEKQNSIPRKFPGTPVQFSWSCQRHGLFSHCPRACYHRHYAADGGWDRFAGDSAREAYTLKYALSGEEWLRGIMSDALRETFLLQRPERTRFPGDFAQHFKHAAFHLYAIGATAALNNEWQQDPKKLHLLESHMSAVPLERILEKLRGRLAQLSEKLINGETFRQLCALPYLAFKPLEPPLNFTYDGIEVWVAPELVWMEADSLVILSLRLNEPENEEEWKLSHAVCTLWGMHRFGLPQRQIFCETLVLKDTDDCVSVTLSGQLELELTKRIISTGASTMRACLPPDGGLPDASGFPKRTESPDNACASCRYAQICWPAAKGQGKN